MLNPECAISLLLHRGWSKLHGLRPWVLKLLRHKDAYIACLGGVSIHMSFYLTSVSVCFAPPSVPLFFFFFSKFWPSGIWDLSSPTGGQTGTLQWKHRALTTGPYQGSNFYLFMFWPWHSGSSPTKDQTVPACTGTTVSTSGPPGF